MNEINNDSTNDATSTQENDSTTTPKIKTKKTRTVDYSRTDKTPHSFRYKRGSAFTTRSAEVCLSKESDGAFVIGPLPNGVEAEANAGKLEGGTLKLTSVKKRPNGKIAITFESDTGAQIIAYDARAARAALRTT